MPKGSFVQGWFTPMDPGAHPEHPIVLPPEGPVDPGFGKPSPIDPGYGVRPPVDPNYGIPVGEHPMHPIVIPPLPGVWPPPGVPTHPIVVPPPPSNSGPTYIEGTKDNPITTAPGTLQPDLPSGSVPMGTVALLVNIPGVEGSRWLTYSTTAQPK